MTPIDQNDISAGAAGNGAPGSARTQATAETPVCHEPGAGAHGLPPAGGAHRHGLRGAAIRADLTLLLVAAIWGSGFVAQRDAMEHMGPMTFNAARYALGTLALLPMVWGRLRRSGLSSRMLWAGVWLGLAMCIAAGLQQIGIQTTTATRAGFITGLYVLLVPVVGFFFGDRPSLGHVVGGVLAVAGMGFLSGLGSSAGGGSGALGGLSVGDMLVAGCAVAWAVHVVLVARVAPHADAVVLAWVQFVVVTVIATVVAVLFESPTAGQIGAGWVPVLYSGVLAIGVAFTLQIVGQKTAPAMHAAIIMSMEAVFGAISGMIMLHERLNAVEWLGCGLMLGGVIVSQVWPVRWSLRGRRWVRERLRDPVR